MNILQELIHSLNKEDQRSFKLFINRTNSTNERKDEQLFNYIRNTYPEYDENVIQKQLYNSTDKNSLYRLKNRLLSDIAKSITIQYFDELDFNETLYNIALAKLFINKEKINIANYFLDRAQKIAQQNEYFELLDLIYVETIKLSQETLEINPEEYIKRRKENRDIINKIQEIDDILAALIYRIKTTQLYSGKGNTKIVDVLQKTVDDFSKDKKLKKSPSLRFHMYHAVSRILLQKEDYVSLENYLIKTYHEFSKENLFNKNNHDTKLQMLTYIVNASFKNEKKELSLEYANKLRGAIDEYNKLLYDKYLFFYYNSLVICYAEKEKDKAIEILLEAKENPVIQKIPIHIAFIYANLSVSYFGKHDFKNALKSVLRLIRDDNFQKLDDGFQLKIVLIELMLHCELMDFNFLEHRIKQTIKKYASLSKNIHNKRDFEMIRLIQQLINGLATDSKNKKTIAAIHSFTQKYTSDPKNEIVSYDDWLKSKIAK